VDEEQLMAAAGSLNGTLRRPTMVACSLAGEAPLAAAPAGDGGTTWKGARAATTERRRLSEALLEREEGEARVAFFQSREESKSGKEWGRLWFALKEGRWRRGLDGARGSLEVAQAREVQHRAGRNGHACSAWQRHS
jgi:hypothetical protein